MPISSKCISLLLPAIQRLLIPKGKPVDQGQFLTLAILNDLELFGDVAPLEGRRVGLSAFGQEDGQGMLIPVEGKILPNELINDEILIGEIGTIGRRIVEGTKDLSPNPRPDL